MSTVSTLINWGASYIVNDLYVRWANPQAGDAKPAVPNAAALNSTHFGDGVVIDMLDVNLTEYKNADEAQVRFFPNGTSDEMTLILHSGDQYRKISLEVTTGLASLQVIH